MYITLTAKFARSENGRTNEMSINKKNTNTREKEKNVRLSPTGVRRGIVVSYKSDVDGMDSVSSTRKREEK